MLLEDFFIYIRDIPRPWYPLGSALLKYLVNAGVQDHINYLFGKLILFKLRTEPQFTGE